jgi:hypothetical protein
MFEFNVSKDIKISNNGKWRKEVAVGKVAAQLCL